MYSKLSALCLCLALSLSAAQETWRELYEKGLASLRAADTVAARSAFQEMLDRDAEVAEAYYGLGRVHALTPGGEKKAIDFYKKAVKLNPGFEPAYLEISRSWIALADSGKAIDALRAGCSKNPGFSRGWSELARLLIRPLQPDETAAALHAEAERDTLFRSPCVSLLLDSLDVPSALTPSQWERLLAHALFVLERDSLGALHYWTAVDTAADSLDFRALYNDLCYLMSDSEYADWYTAADTAAGIPAYLRAFWQRRDPNLSTGLNERLGEHYRRLTHAFRNYRRVDVNAAAKLDNLHRAGHPLRKLAPMGIVVGDAFLKEIGFPEAIPVDRPYDNMGLIYIRHGEPDNKATAVDWNVEPGDLPPKLIMFFQNDAFGAMDNYKQMLEWEYGTTLDPMNMSWKYNAARNRPEMVFHFIKYGGNTGWIIEAVPSMLDNRDDLGLHYFQLRRSVIAYRLSEIAMKTLDQDPQGVVYGPEARTDISNISMTHTTKVPDLVQRIKEESYEHARVGLTTETSSFTLDNEPLDFRFYLAGFKGDPGENAVQVYYSVLGKNTELSGEGGGTRLILSQSFTFSPEDGEEPVRLKKENRIDVGLQPESWKRRGVLGVETLTMEPGDYVFELLFWDKTADRLGQYRGEFENQNFWSNKLRLSDVLLVSDIHPPRPGDEFIRGNVAFRPRMFSDYRRGEKVGIYFEVYNLALDREGKTDFRVTYELSPPGRQGLVDRLKGLFGGGTETVSSQYDYSGTARDDNVHLTFDFGDQLSGDLELDISVEDRNARLEANRVVMITVR